MGLIVDDDVLYSSREEHLARFEVVVFANALNRSISAGNWRLHKMVLVPLDPEATKELVFVKTERVGNFDVLFCLMGSLDDAVLGYQLLDAFHAKVTAVYQPSQLMSMSGGKAEILKQLCDEAAVAVIEQLEGMDEISGRKGSYPDVPPRIHYCGISSQGLPIASRMFDEEILQHLPPELEMPGMSVREYVETTLSAKCATIVMNSLIRAQANVQSLELKVDDQHYHFIYFKDVGAYTVEMYGSGNPEGVERLFELVAQMIEDVPGIPPSFTGDLKPYAPLKELLGHLPERLAERLG